MDLLVSSIENTRQDFKYILLEYSIKKFLKHKTNQFKMNSFGKLYYKMSGINPIRSQKLTPDS